MPPKTLLDIPFPLGGLNRRLGYRDQPPHTTENCLNVRPTASFERRSRGGSRPGLSQMFDGKHLGSPAVITDVTNDTVTPIVVTSVAHERSNNDRVTIVGVKGNTAANGTFDITVLTANTFSLQQNGADVVGVGNYTSGGTWGMPVRMASLVTYVPANARAYSTDDFEGIALSSEWRPASWQSDGIPNVNPESTDDPGVYVKFDGQTVAVAESFSGEDNQVTGAVHSPLDINTSTIYYVEAFLVPRNNRYNGKYQLFARMNDILPLVLADGLKAEIVLEDAFASESIQNGTFGASTGWQEGEGWTIAAGVATYVDPGGFTSKGSLLQDGPDMTIPLVQGETYLVSFDTTIANGNVSCSVGGKTFVPNKGTGSYLFFVTPTFAMTPILFVPDGTSGFNGTIDNVSVTKASPSGVFTGSLKVYESNVLQDTFTFDVTQSPLENVQAGWFRMAINADNVVCTWRGITVLDQDIDAAEHAALTGKRVGFGIQNTQFSTNGCYIDVFRTQWFSSSATEEAVFPGLAVSAGGLLYFEDDIGTLGQVTTNLRIADDREIRSIEHNQKLYIADWSEPNKSGSDGRCSGVTFDDVAGTDWTTIGIDVNSYVVEVFNTDPADNVEPGVYEIASFDATNITLTHSTGGTGPDSCSYRIQRAPKVFDPSAGTLSIWNNHNDITGATNATPIEITSAAHGAITGDQLTVFGIEGNTAANDTWVITVTGTNTFTLDNSVGNGAYTSNGAWKKGDIPVGSPLIVRYRDRIVLGGAKNAPHVWFMSRQSNPDDWDFSLTSDDTGRAIAGQDSEAGAIGLPLTAFAPHTDDFMLISAETELYIMRGDPAFGGIIDNLSREIGILSANAWTNGPEGEFMFLSRDGLYIMRPGVDAFPKSVSREFLPNELLSIDVRIHEVAIEYDVRHRGVHISVTAKDNTKKIRFWFDWETKSFWPELYDVEHEPTIMYNYIGRSERDGAVLWGGRDGFLRKHLSDNTTDDSTAFQSFIVLGPFRTSGEDYHTGRVDELLGTLARESANVEVGLLLGENHEDATKIVLGTVTGATNATPIVLSALNNLADGEEVRIQKVGGNLSANGTYNAANATSTTFELAGSKGTGAYTSGGTWTRSFKMSEVWQAGTNRKLRPRRRGGAFSLVLNYEGALAWAVENITALLAPVGRQRKL